MKMKDSDKSREELIIELEELKQQHKSLEEHFQKVITERKIKDNDLIDSEMQLRETQKLAKIGSWTTDLSNFNVRWSEETYRIFEIDPKSFKASHQAFLEFVHPEDKKMVDDAFMLSFSDPKINRIEHRILTPAGKTKFVEEFWQIIADSQGKPVRAVGSCQDITERKLVEEALLRNEERFYHIAESSGMWVWEVDRTGLYTYVNPMIEHILGYNQDGLVGKKYFYDFFEPSRKESLKNMALAAFSRREAFKNFENPNIHADGRLIILETSGFPIIDESGNLIGYRGVDKDITERKQVEEELRKKNSFIQTVLDNLPIGVALNELEKGSAFYHNKKFVEIYGWPAEEMTDISVFFQNVYPDEKYRNELISRVMGDIQSNDPSRMHWENIVVTCKDGSRKIVNSANIPLSEQNIMVSTVFDVTEQKRAESELLAAIHKAEESDRLKSAFLANMSHEIRTPMNGILGFTELLKEPKLSGEEQQKYIDIIEKSGDRLLSIINDIISLSKIEAGQTEVTLVQTNINEQFEYLHNFFKAEADAKGLELSYKTALNSQEAIINTDKEKIFAILINLIKNAIKFTPSGSIEFGYVRKSRFLEFYVKDTGIGIPAEQIELVFERFRQGTQSMTRSYEGAGLGLSIAKGFVDILGGKIWVESKAGQGSTFFFTIPFNKDRLK